MFDMDCCRTCLARSNLNPIFQDPNKCDGYSHVLLLTTGLKIIMHDDLSQLICTKCVNIINNHISFMERCHISQSILQNKTHNVKTEVIEINFELEDNITNCGDVLGNHTTQSETTVEDILNKQTNIQIKNIPNKKVIMKYENVDKTAIETKYENEDNSDIENNVEMKCENADNGDIKRNDEDVNKSHIEKNDENTDNIDIKRNDENLDNSDIKKNDENEDKTTVKKKVNETVQNTGPLECKYCKKKLKHKSSLYSHYKIHFSNIICEHCGKTFVTRRKLLMHCRARHGYEKTDKCSYCDYRASTKENVKIHERLHTGERPYVCKECGDGFHRQSSYQQHIATHLPEKTVQCEQCPARFKSVTLMKIHAHKHSCRFRCTACGNIFMRRRNVARHLANVHGLPPTAANIQRERV